jgi:DNA invertase Pin-like site-specific DNA recombinase
MRVIIAARLSKLQKNGRQGIGLDTQDKRSCAWAEREGHEVITDPIADTKSGTVAPWDRKNLRPWVTEPERMAQYDGIIAFKNDRLSRGVWADEARIRLWAEDHGKTLMIVDGPQWPPRHDGDKYSWEGQASAARKEWEEDRERSMRAQRELMEQGKLVGKPPWGYASAGEKYDRRAVTTPEGEQYAPEMFTRIADGEKLPAVAKWLSEVTGRTWHPRTVAILIRNTAYRGRYQMGGGKYVHQCPALVEGDLWRRANASLDARPSSRRGQRNDLTGASLLSGLAYCGNPECTAGDDSPMYRIAPPGRDVAYRCSGRGATRKGCGNLVTLADADALLNRLMSGLRRPVLRPVFHPATGHQIEIDDLTQQLRDLPLRELDDATEDAERARLRAARRALADLPATPARTEYVPVTGDDGEALTYGAKWAASDQAERRAWLKDAGFSVYLAKPRMLADSYDGDEGDGLLSTVDVYESADAALIFRWTDDKDAGLARGLS